MQIDEHKRLRNRGTWWSDWGNTEQRDQALSAAFDYSGISATVVSKRETKLESWAAFDLAFQNNRKLVVWLDQGWSYWSVASNYRQTALASFNMNASISDLGETLAEFRIGVQGHQLPTQISNVGKYYESG